MENVDGKLVKRRAPLHGGNCKDNGKPSMEGAESNIPKWFRKRRKKYASKICHAATCPSTTYAGRSYRSRIVHLACLIPICLLETIVVISKWTLFSHVEKFNT